MSQGPSKYPLTVGPQGPQGIQGLQGIQGIQGPRGAPNVGARMPSGYVEMVAPVGTVAAALEDVAGATTTVTLTSTASIVVTASVNVKTQAGAGATVLGLALNINGTDYATYQVNLSGSADLTVVGLTERSPALVAGVYTVKLRFYRVSGADTPGVDKATLVALGLQQSVEANPPWWGVVYGAAGDCNPATMLEIATRDGSTAATASNVGITVARICYFRPPADITVNKIRFFGVGVTAGVFRTAIYNGDTLARLTAELPITTALSTWGSVGAGLALTLYANQLYFIAVSPNAVGAVTGLLGTGTTQTVSTGQIAILPKFWPGNMDIDLGYNNNAFAQFTTIAGALPDTAPTIEVQGLWTGGFPAFWLDSNNA